MLMTKERLLLSIETIKENIKILKDIEPEDAGANLQLEHEKHILELLQAEAEERLFVSPVKIGNKVWFIQQDDEDEWYTSEETVIDVSSKGFYYSEFLDGGGAGILELYDEIGETVFLSQEEAEKAIIQLQEKAND